ncbi:MAG: lyase family protein, partial [Litorimonas sp.]
MNSKTDAPGQSMWGGRFSARPSEIMQAINASIGFDRKLAAEDIAGSKAHSDMLAAQGIITPADRDAIHDGLDAILAEIEAGEFPWSEELEDIHLNVEARLKDRIGEAGGRLHTGRSRNDQVATDFRLWTRKHLDLFDALLTDLMRALLEQAEAHADTIMPGFTHLQSAQPVTFGHHMMAYLE